jgi:cephalosporin-C deacetylase-like acetyl esterase
MYSTRPAWTAALLSLTWSAAAQPGSGGPAADPALFAYASSRPLDIVETSSQEHDDVIVHDITYAKVDGGRNRAYLVEPSRGGKHAGILFVHWYGPPEPTSNRTQFLEDARELGRGGAVSVLIETMWSDPDYFPKRSGNDDFEASVGQVKELRRALDLLLARPDVDPARVALVGHDFGAMYGALLAVVDRRPTVYVFMAGTKSFSDWFLYRPKREGEERRAFIEKLAPLDPIRYVPAIAPAPLLMQFAVSDPHVPKSAAEALFNAARQPKEIRWYDADHALNAEATRDRIGWLETQLKLRGGK